MSQVSKSPIYSDAAGAGLCLHLPGCCPQGAACSTTRTTQMTAPDPTPQPKKPVQMPLTIVYGDRAYTVEVTEGQALKILSTARQGLKQNAIAGGRGTELERGSGRTAAATSVSVLGQSMKRSLQRFLEKRAARKTGSSPYSTSPAQLHSSPFSPAM